MPAFSARPALAAVLAGLTLSAAGVTGPAAAAPADPAAPSDPTPVVVLVTDPTLPVQVAAPRSGPRAVVQVALRTTRAVPDLTIRATGEALEIDSAVQQREAAAAGSLVDLELPVTATTDGFHELDLAVTSSDGGSASLTLPYVYRAGSVTPGDDSLAGRSWAHNDYYVGDGGSGARSSDLLTFVDGTRATFGPKPLQGQRCRCRTYSYDADTGLVQMAGGIVGQVRSDYFSGIVSTGDAPFEGIVFDPVASPRPGTHLADRWTFRSRYGDDGIYSQTLRLTRGGRYNLSAGYNLDYGYGSQKLAGRYTIGKAGRLVLRDRQGSKVLQVARLAVVVDRDGTLRPSRGVRLTQTIEVGRSAPYTDGNLLLPS